MLKSSDNVGNSNATTEVVSFDKGIMLSEILMVEEEQAAREAAMEVMAVTRSASNNKGDLPFYTVNPPVPSPLYVPVGQNSHVAGAPRKILKEEEWINKEAGTKVDEVTPEELISKPKKLWKKKQKKKCGTAASDEAVPDLVELDDEMTQEESDQVDADVEEVLNDMDEEERTWVLQKIKSSATMTDLVLNNRRERDQKQSIIKLSRKKSKSKGESRLSEEIGIRKRIEKMRIINSTFLHLSQSKLNRMVTEGDISGGIELNEEARYKSEAHIIAKGTKKSVHSKRSPKRQRNEIGNRAPFFMVEMDLIDLTNDTEGNDWGYKWLMVIICKEYGTLKIYPLKGKDDVKPRWLLFKQWLKVITPFVITHMGVRPEVMVVGTDRGS